MQLLFQKINALQRVRHISKHEQIIQGVISSIDEGVLQVNDKLPSLGQMKKELGFAEKTIIKAFDELKSRGIVESKKRKGYYVIDNRTNQAVRVMLFMYAFEMYQQTFYQSFKFGVGENVHVDTFFHHGNPKVFKHFLSENLGNYSLFVIAPVHHPEALELLKLIPPKKLLIVDRKEDLGLNYSYIAQDFENYTFQGLSELLKPILSFQQMTLFFPLYSELPQGTLVAFKKFIHLNKITGYIEDYYVPGSLKKNNVYFTMNDLDLWALLLDCQKLGYEVGKDVGIIAQDDTPAKAIVHGGITVISADFSFMAQMAAEYVLNRTLIREIIPAQLIRRKSL